ncbi:MAG: hypothetical protein ACRYE9_05040, partial [Janthinobacterium lividum]
YFHAFRRYAELDKFALFSIRNKYNTLFENMLTLLDKTESSRDFLQSTICRKFGQDFHAINAANSALKLRAIANERANIMQQLAKINFVNTFDLGCLNNIASLNFTKQLRNNNSISPAEYIRSIIRSFLSNASSSQLSILYNCVAKSEEDIHKIMKLELNKQIEERTTLARFIRFIITGKKHEYDKLKTIRKDLQNLVMFNAISD